MTLSLNRERAHDTLTVSLGKEVESQRERHDGTASEQHAQRSPPLPATQMARAHPDIRGTRQDVRDRGRARSAHHLEHDTQVVYRKCDRDGTSKEARSDAVVHRVRGGLHTAVVICGR